MAQELGMGIDLRISPSFHPQVIASMDEFDADTQPVLQQAVDAFTSVYEGLGKVHDAKAAAQANTAWPENSRPGALKASTRKWYEFYVTKVFADWQDKPVVSVTRDMVKDKHAQLARDGLPGKKVKGGAPASANSAMVVLRILLNYAADEHQLADGSPLIASNPVAAMKRHWAPAGDRTDRYVPFEKVGEVWNALHEARTTARNIDTLAGINFVLFLMTTGARRSEVASLRWSDVCIDRDDPAKSYWFADDRKVGKPTRFNIGHVAWAHQLVATDIQRFRSRKQAGDVGNDDQARERKLASILRGYLTHPVSPGYKVPEAMWRVSIVPRSYMQIRTQRLAPFNNHRSGASRSLDETVQSMIASGYLMEVDKLKVAEQYGPQGKCYRILKLPN